MQRQVITIAPDGAVSGLQVKPGRGLDLKKVGKASIKRASEVLFDEERQQWYVEIRAGQYAGKIITKVMLATAQGTPVRYNASEPTAYFDEYDDAVAGEIAVLDHIRLREGPSVL